ncbi:hypothetical protein VB671_06450 [Nodularia spumigena UHCC 0040]|nr:hypothetical protein [Nodularia spumigena UHCC 0040]
MTIQTGESERVTSHAMSGEMPISKIAGQTEFHTHAAIAAVQTAGKMTIAPSPTRLASELLKSSRMLKLTNASAKQKARVSG